jgi:hypothetical protein
MASPSRRPCIALLLSTLLIASACGGDDDEDGSDAGEDGSDAGELIMNECGTFDPNQTNTDSVIPDDPASAEIVDACDALCQAMSDLDGCSIDLDDCVDDCRLTSCDYCPSTLVPLTECRTEFFDPAACTCSGGVAECDLPADCTELMDDTYQCGG